MVMKDKFQLLYPFPALRFQITFIKPDKEKFTGSGYLKAMCILRKNHKQFIVAVGQFMIVDNLRAFPSNTKTILKKVFLCSRAPYSFVSKIFNTNGW